MATKVMMEALSPTMEEGRLVKWLKNVGDAVKSGDTIAEVETDKAIMELVARGDGVLRARLVEEGATSAIGETIGVIAAADEDISALTGGAAAPSSAPMPAAATPAPDATPVAAAAPTPPTAVAPSSSPADAPASAMMSGPVRSSPLARRLAAERGLALESVTGTGPNGRVIRRDVESAPRATQAAPATSPPIAPVIASSTSVGAAPSTVTDVPLTMIRKTIARRLSESIGPIPTFYLTSEIDMTKIGQLREQMSAAGDQFKVSVNDIIIKAAAIALTRHPEVNAHWMGDSIRYFSAVHIGMAVATEDGLIVPVIRDAHSKGLGQIGKEARDYARRARERKLAPAEYSGGTFSVSNLGMFGIDQFTAIINPPEAAILAVGATETKPVWENGAFVPRQRMRVTLSCDHRVIDGAIGAKFLQTLRQLLEAPLLMVF
jgi:pyruvate dehydrogenase E2 component (dihydrolipoamide acetyltransferase)